MRLKGSRSKGNKYTSGLRRKQGNVIGIDGLHSEDVCLLFRRNGQVMALQVLCLFLNKILAGDFSRGPRSTNRLGVGCIENVSGMYG